MGGRTQRGTRAASERGELVGGGAGGAAGADRACRPGGLQTARARSRGRAAARLGPARARLERVRADRGGAVVRCGDRPATVRRPGQQREYPRRAPRPGTRARALCRDGTGAVGGASPGGSGARVSGGGRPGRGPAGARAGGGRLPRAARCTGARSEWAGGPDGGGRGGAAERSGVRALLQQLPGDRVPGLGSALLLVARGDSARAVQSLRLAAGRLETASGGGGGRADILLLAGRIAVRL